MAKYTGVFIGVEEDSELKVTKVMEYESLKKTKINGNWFVGWQNPFLLEFYKNKKLSGMDFRVQGYLMFIMGFDNIIHINQTKAASELDIPRSCFATSLKKLIDLGFVFKETTSGNSTQYRLHPSLGFKGNLGKGQKEKRKAEEDQ